MEEHFFFELEDLTESGIFNHKNTSLKSYSVCEIDSKMDNLQKNIDYTIWVTAELSKVRLVRERNDINAVTVD